MGYMCLSAQRRGGERGREGEREEIKGEKGISSRTSRIKEAEETTHDLGKRFWIRRTFRTNHVR